MTYIICHNIRHSEGSMLIHAAAHNNEEFAKKILHLCGKMEPQSKNGLMSKYTQSTSIVVAAVASHRDERMVRLLLQAGLDSTTENAVGIPLAMAIIWKHENIAILLSQDFQAGYKLKGTHISILHLAAVHGLVNLVQDLIGREHKKPENDVDILHRSNVLYQLLHRNVTRASSVVNNNHGATDDVYEITKILLRHKANPDLPISNGVSFNSTRKIADRHTDPRFRTLLSEFPLPVGSDNTSIRPMLNFPHLRRDQIGTFPGIPSNGEYRRMRENNCLDVWIPKPNGWLRKDEAFAPLLEWTYYDCAPVPWYWKTSWESVVLTGDFYRYHETNNEARLLGASDLAVVLKSEAERVKKNSDVFENPASFSSLKQASINRLL
ncbi:hypothetical protein GQ44DRAFT_722685 [Phaeosphaeriaceae sp. PMI808]|nr:hypothetical protein GQ44DRAFT_722685 [Phaeosphaeriaceae sp. PMI808]